MLTRRLPTKAAVVLVVLLLAGSAFSADKALLRERYKQGDKYLAEMVSDQQITQTSGNQTNTMKQTMKMEMGMEILSVDAEGTGDIKVTYRRIAMKQESPYGTLDYDSADPAKKDVSQASVLAYKALVGNWIVMKMTDRGEVKGIKGTEKIVKSILDGIPQGPGRETAARQLAQMLDEEHFSQQMSGFSILLPEGPVGVGDTWARDQKMNLGFANMLVRTNYKVRELAADTVDIDVAATVEGAGEPDAGMPMTVTIGQGSRQSGTTRVNRANAVLTTAQLSQTMNMTVTVQGRAIKQQVTGTATIVVKPDGGP